MRDFRFTNELNTHELGDTIGVLRRPRLWVPEADYPDYHYWLDKAEAELANGSKRAMLAYAGREPIGAVLYQRYKEDAMSVEIKNISVSPDMRGRYIGAFMLRNTEAEALAFDYPGSRRMVVDTKAANAGMVGFLLRQGYQPQGATDLYGLGAGIDITFAKQP